MRILLSLLLFSQIYLSKIVAQEKPEELWNMREKNRLIEHIEKDASYTGLFYYKYNFNIHKIFPGKDSVTYVRINTYDSIVCTYPNTGAEEVVSNIFRDENAQEAEACKVLMRKNPSFKKQVFAGYKDNNLVTAIEISRDEYELAYLETKQTFKNLTKNLIPVVYLNGALLAYDPINQKTYLKNGDKQTPMTIEPNDFFKRTRVRSSVRIDDDKIYFIQPNKNDYTSIYRIDSENNSFEMFLEEGAFPIFTKNYIYFLKDDGIYRKKKNRDKNEKVVSKDFLKAFDLNPFFRVEENDENFYFNLGNGNLSIWHISLFEEIDLTKLNDLKKQISQLNNQLIDEGIDPWQYNTSDKQETVEEAGVETEEYESEESEAMAEVDVAVEAESIEEEAEVMVSVEEEMQAPLEHQQKMLPPLTQDQKKRLEKMNELKQQRQDENDKLEKRFEKIAQSDKIKWGFIPENYSLEQNPLDKSIIFIPENPEFPTFNTGDILYINID